MRTTTIGHVERKINASAKATITYERAFSGKHKLHEDVNAIMHMTTGPITVLDLDALFRLEYVFERDATEELFPSYDAWLEGFPVEELDQLKLQSGESWVRTLLDEVLVVFFPKYAKPNLAATGAGVAAGAAAGAQGPSGPSQDVEGASHGTD